MHAQSDDITVLLASWKQGDRTALDRLAPLIRGELRRIAQRQNALHRKVGQAEGLGDIGRVPAFLDEPGEGLPPGDLVGIEPRGIFDQRGLDSGGIVPAFQNRAGQGFGLRV